MGIVETTLIVDDVFNAAVVVGIACCGLALEVELESELPLALALTLPLGALLERLEESVE